MSGLALQLESVSKLYRLGQMGTGTLTHDLNRLWARLRGREDPFAKIGAVNDREAAGDEYVWALRDINFEVKQGEILGIIGRNGAGKSTLLKLLSRVTAPTEGVIRINGRIASLLEVGTGFHPELTGRENIFLNGAILGMTKQEIRARFDEIVEFSGCAKYIDTPVKRYSSGMYVRLAFAVAAHLETDVLIVDEVLAVGDAEFQSKCLGKMRDISQKSHRTVLFVSHNMASVRQLCPRAILLDMGMIEAAGRTDAVIEDYLTSDVGEARFLQWESGQEPRSEEISVDSVEVLDARGRHDTILSTADALGVAIRYRIHEPIRNLRICVTAYDGEGAPAFSTSDYLFQDDMRIRSPGTYSSVCHIPPYFLNAGRYRLEIDFEVPLERQVLPSLALSVEISELAHNQLGPIMANRPKGALHPQLDWDITKV